jgi:hypothetical protein
MGALGSLPFSCIPTGYLRYFYFVTSRRYNFPESPIGSPSPVLAFRPIRGLCPLISAAALLMLFSQTLLAQETEPSLGDIARSLRKKPMMSETVIDNDNLNQVVDAAESHRAAGWPSVFSLAEPAKNVQISGPDVMCSLAYTGKNSSQLDDPLLLEDLPREELSKLDGPASIDGDTFQVSTHNGTAWELRELVIGLTIVRSHDEASSTIGQAHLVPAIGATSQWQDLSQKQPDSTILLHLKGMAAPSSTVTFRTTLNFALFPDQDWHWSILKAKGIPPEPITAPESAEVPSLRPSTLNSRTAPELNPSVTAPVSANPKKMTAPPN